MEQTGIFIVEDSEDKPASFWNRFTSLIRPVDLPREPPMVMVCYESPSYKRQNLLDALRPSGIDSPVLRAIRSVLKKGGMVAGNAAIMVIYSRLHISYFWVLIVFYLMAFRANQLLLSVAIQSALY